MASRSGELAMRPLPAVLLDLHEELATGKLTLKRGRVSKTVDLVSGNPVSTASTQRDETLGHFLVHRGVITEQQQQQAVARMADRGGKFGEALVSLNVITFTQLIEQLGKQARHMLVQALRWPQGAWRFEPAEQGGQGIQLRMVEVVLEGLRETAAFDLQRLARLEGMSFVLTDRGVKLRHELKRVFGEAMLELLGDGATIRELERALPNRANARLTVDAMLLCDAIVAHVEERGPSASSASTSLPAAPPVFDDSSASSTIPTLYDFLFDDVAFAADGAVPLGVIGDGVDSGIVSIEELTKAAADLDVAAAAARTIAAEYQRIQGADHYAVLMIGRRANAKEIATAASIRASLLERDARALTDARDRARATEIHEAYRTAHSVLLDDRRRGSYDRELLGGELMQAPPAIDAELTFRVAEELMAKSQWAAAIGQIRKAISRAPGEADYHAALGWAAWMANERTAAAADLARPHLNAALEINPDHAAAHDYKGRITAAQQIDDDEAMFHLEKAIDLDPSRAEAVAVIEAALIARGELRRLERVLKRLLFRLRGRGTLAEAKAWARLARLYFDHLDDPHGADAAAATARRIAPSDGDVQALIERAENRAYTAEPLRAGWREALGDPHSGSALVKTTEASGHTDAAFLAASTMVAHGTADAQMIEIYEARRARAVPMTTRPLAREHWTLLRHKDDAVELGALMELVAPAVHRIAPMTLAESDLDAGQHVDDLDLPGSFLRLRERSSAMLGVPSPPVYSRVELGMQIHVLACDPPVLIAGDDALRAPEGPDLVFRLVRAMTFLWPGRAVGASRPGRTLRAVVMAVVREASGSSVGKDDPLAEQAADAVSRLGGEARVQARAAVLRLLSRGGGLNLSLWARSLSRTADRAGMLLCGDVPAAFAGARDVGELDRDLVEFAYSAAHVQLRKQLGLSRGDSTL